MTAAIGAEPGSRLTFDPERHLYKLDGRAVPSVSQIVKVADPFNELVANAASGYQLNLIEAAREHGKDVHEALAVWDRHPRRKAPDIPEAEEWRLFLRTAGLQVIAVEEMVYHETLGYAGTLDRLCADDQGRVCLVDLKTGEQRRSHMVQLAGYRLALERMGWGNIYASIAVYLRPDGHKTIWASAQSERDDAVVFRSSLNILNWRTG